MRTLLRPINLYKNTKIYCSLLTKKKRFEDRLSAFLYKKYNNATWFWIQEEPLNMGAASFLQMNLKTINYGFISRQPGASPASARPNCRSALSVRAVWLS